MKSVKREATAGRVLRTAVAILSIGVSSVALAQGASRVLTVDAGRGADTGDGSPAHPFKTISRCAAVATSGESCLVHTGTYGEMLMPPHDGVSIQGAPGETVVITSADPIAGAAWTAAGKGVFTAHVVIDRRIPASHKGQSWPGDAVFFNGNDVPEAQWPAPGADRLRPHWATIASVPVSDQKGGAATLADPAMPAFSSPNRQATIHIWSGPDPFAEYDGAVLSAPGKQVTYAPLGAFESNYAAPNGRYYVIGAAELLTTNSWFYDAQKQQLSWMPPAGVDPSHAGIRVKQRPATIDLSGRSNITIRNITLVGGGVVMDKASQHNVLDQITARYLSDTLRPHALAPGNNGDLYNFGILLDGTDNTLRNSSVAFTSQNGVTIHGSNNVVDNVLVHDVDFFGDGAGGIAIGDYNADVTHPKVLHSTVYRSGGSDIVFSANSRQGKPPEKPFTVIGAEIAGNNLFGAMWLRVDGGVIYACCRNVTTGTRIHDNWIHANVLPSSTDTPGGQKQLAAYAGVYWDNGMGGVDIANNLFWESFPDIFIHGNSSADQPTDSVHISNNTTVDKASTCNLMITAIYTANDVQAMHNRILFAPRLVNKAASGISVADNGPDQAGARISGTPGCTFKGCVGGESAPAFPAGSSSNLPAAVCNKPYSTAAK